MFVFLELEPEQFLFLILHIIQYYVVCVTLATTINISDVRSGESTIVPRRYAYIYLGRGGSSSHPTGDLDLARLIDYEF